jgi:hypothetical protein
MNQSIAPKTGKITLIAYQFPQPQNTIQNTFARMKLHLKQKHKSVSKNDFSERRASLIASQEVEKKERGERRFRPKIEGQK